MLSFKNFLLLREELNDRQKEEVSKWPRDPKAIAATDHYFGKDNDDITTPLEGTQDKSEIHKKVEEHLGREISIENYRKNTTTDKHNRTTGVSKLIKDPKLLQDFNNDNTRQGNKYTGLSIHTTRSAHGVAGQTSSGQSWEDESCKNFETGSNRKYLKPEVKHGTVVTYLKDHTGKEIARAALHPHHNNEGHVAYALNSYYGIDHADFKEHIDQLSQDLSGPHKGGNLTYKIHPDVYNDMSHQTILHTGISETGLKNIQSKHPNDLSIQRLIFNHPNVTSEMLHDGIKSNNLDKAVLAVTSSRLTRDHIDTALKHGSAAVREAAMDNPITSRTQLHTALKDVSEDVRNAAMMHPKINKTHISAVLNDETNSNNPFIRQQAVKHKSATEDHINQGLADQKYSVRLAAIRNENATPNNITKALNIKSDGQGDNDVYLKRIHHTAINHPNANKTHFEMGLNHPNATIRNISQIKLNRLSNKS
jgi:hypothetical protein